VLALWITSPPDVIDAFIFRSPTPFSIWGVIAMWGVFAAGFLAAFRTRLGLKPALWRLCHLTIAVIIVVGTVMHAMLIEGTMGIISKATLCALSLAATLKILLDTRPWTYLTRRKA